MNRFPQVARTFLSRRPTTDISRTMKLRYTALAAALAGSSAWVPSPLANRFTSRVGVQSSYSLQPMGSSSVLFSTMAAENIETVAALTPTGKPIAEGVVVSVFHGGLVAVRVDDDDFDLPEEAPEVLDTTNSAPQETSKSSSLSM